MAHGEPVRRRELSRRRRRSLAAWLIAASLATAVVVAGCSKNTGAGGGAGLPAAGPAGAADKDNSRGDAAQEGTGGFVGAPAPSAAPGGGNSNQVPNRVEPQQRSVIYAGTMSVRVEDVNSAANRAVTIATSAGGHVGADRRQLDDQRSEANITLRVPADRFDATLAELAKLGKEEVRAVQAQDVTEVVIDLDARLASQQTSVDRVRALLARANTIGEVVSVESELSRREADLASLQARKRGLSDQVSLSTITVTLLGPAAPTPKPDEPETGFLVGLKNGWKAFLASIEIVLTVLGALIPWIVAIGLPMWLVIWLLRRRNRGRFAPTGPTPAIATTYGLSPMPAAPRPVVPPAAAPAPPVPPAPPADDKE